MQRRDLIMLYVLGGVVLVMLIGMISHVRDTLQIGSVPTHSAKALSELRSPTPTSTPTPGWWDTKGTPTPTKTPKSGKKKKKKKSTPTATPTLQDKILFVTDRENGWEQIWVMDNTGKNQHKLEVPKDNFLRDKAWEVYNKAKDAQSWSPGHDHKVYVGPDAALWVFFPQDKTKWLLRAYGTAAYDPAWGPDGRIAFVSNLDGNDEIYLTNPDGKGIPLRLTHNSWEWDKGPTWSPNGRQIAFWSNRTGNKQIWVMNADGRDQRDLSQNGFNDWSPVWVHTGDTDKGKTKEKKKGK